MTQNLKAASRTAAFAWVIFSYLIAILLGTAVGYWAAQAGHHIMVAIAIADIVATLIIFAFSYLFDNSSF